MAVVGKAVIVFGWMLPERNLTGLWIDNGHVENPSNPYWTYVKSNVGKVRIDKPGLYKLSLKPETIESAKKLGLTSGFGKAGKGRLIATSYRERACSAGNCFICGRLHQARILSAET